MNTKLTAKAMGPANLVMSHFTLERTHPIEDRVASAAAAGFDGIGLYIGEYARLKGEGFAPHGLRDLLAEHDVLLAEIEVVRGWAATTETREQNERAEAIAWEMADEFACRYLQAIGPSSGSVADDGRKFGELCDRAGDHGLVVGIEFLPFTNIVDASQALAIVEAADRANGGICVDIWHHTRGANDLSLIEAIPADKVLGIQMNDGPLVADDPDYYTDCLHNRVAPGDGQFDVDGFVRLLLAKGVTVPWSLEVCQDQAWGRPGAAHAARCANGMRAALARCK